MLELIIGTNMDRQTLPVSYDATVRSVLEAANIDFSTGSLHLNGVTLRPGDIDKTFSELNVTGNKASLISVVKGDGGR